MVTKPYCYLKNNYMLKVTLTKEKLNKKEILYPTLKAICCSKQESMALLTLFNYEDKRDYSLSYSLVLLL